MSISVLAVDDSRTMRDMITLALTSEGFDVELAEDGEHGLEVLDGIDPDVIITDINMPIMDGKTLFFKIRRPVMLTDQTPYYSDIGKSGHGGGDFLFVRAR